MHEHTSARNSLKDQKSGGWGATFYTYYVDRNENRINLSSAGPDVFNGIWSRDQWGIERESPSEGNFKCDETLGVFESDTESIIGLGPASNDFLDRGHFQRVMTTIFP